MNKNIVTKRAKVDVSTSSTLFSIAAFLFFDMLGLIQLISHSNWSEIISIIKIYGYFQIPYAAFAFFIIWSINESAYIRNKMLDIPPITINRGKTTIVSYNSKKPVIIDIKDIEDVTFERKLIFQMKKPFFIYLESGDIYFRVKGQKKCAPNVENVENVCNELKKLISNQKN